MDKKKLLKDFSYKLGKLRQSFGHSRIKMGAFFGTDPVNYTRYEKGKIFPSFIGMYRFAKATGISLDWLVSDKEPMYYKEKVEMEMDIELPEEKEPGLIRDAEIKELLEHMNRNPLLRHELLVYFYKFREGSKDKDKDKDTKGTMKKND